MSEQTFIPFARIPRNGGGRQRIVGTEGSGLIVGNEGERLPDGQTNIDVIVRTDSVYTTAIQALAGQSRVLTDPKLALALAGGVVMLTSLLERRQLPVALAEDPKPTQDFPDEYTANGWTEEDYWS